MTQEVKKFDAEVGKVLNLMIHSLYTNKEIFMRELISNASDACDKLRYLHLSNPELLDDDSELKIKIAINKDKKIITIRDNGIGMNKEDLIENLGTIARSGTQLFAEQLSGDAKKDSSLIGQFGVGFYSAFMIADKVSVKSRKAGEENVYTWESVGDGEYKVGNFTGDFGRGTEIEIHVKEDAESYLDHFRLKHIVKNYSDHIMVPIYFVDENNNENKINSCSALWTKNKNDITIEQYQEFYKSVSYGADEPWLTIHNKNEGTTEFINLLFIPTNKTFDLFHPDRKRRVKLYIKRVFISDENIDLIPHYLRFLRGVVDSEDLPLNISRETLQHNSVLDKIRHAITKRVLNELAKKKEENREDYIKFWNNFGSALKEGLCEATSDHEKILDVCMFHSVKQGKMISLADYIENCKEEQKNIYYLSGDDPVKLLSSPQLEGFISRDIDVLLFTDNVDDFWVNVNSNYKEYEFKSVTRADIDLSNISPSDNKQENKDNGEQANTEHDKLTQYFKNILGDLVKEVKISRKLTSSPVCLAISEGAMDMRMERFLIEQKQLKTATTKILEINPKHKIIQKITNDLNLDDKLHVYDDIVKLLFDQACVMEGEPVEDVSEFAKRLTYLIESGVCN